jgi:maleate isomerase
MKGWRARIGFMVPPGNPTVEPEMFDMAPRGVSVHFTRMSASGAAGTHEGQDARNRSQIESLDHCMELLSMLAPNVVVMAHTATSYTLGRQAEAELGARLEGRWNVPFITAFGSALAAFKTLGIERIAYATPYNEATTLQGVAHFRAHDIEVISYGRLENVRNIYEENSERAYSIARQVNHSDADAVFLSGVGMPTVDVLEALEQDLGKPVVSAASAMMWNALRVAGVGAPVQGFGKLLQTL